MLKQHGNVLFLILIAVALFAALSYAVTQSSRGGGNSNKETLSIALSEVLQQATTYKTEFLRRSVQGFDITLNNGAGEFFDPNNGLPTFEAPETVADPSAAAGWMFSRGKVTVDGNHLGSNQDDYLLMMRLNEDACLEINMQLHGFSSVPSYEQRDDGPSSGDLVIRLPGFFQMKTVNSETWAVQTVSPPSCYLAPGGNAWLYIDTMLVK